VGTENKRGKGPIPEPVHNLNQATRNKSQMRNTRMKRSRAKSILLSLSGAVVTDGTRAWLVHDICDRDGERGLRSKEGVI